MNELYVFKSCEIHQLQNGGSTVGGERKVNKAIPTGNFFSISTGARGVKTTFQWPRARARPVVL